MLNFIDSFKSISGIVFVKFIFAVVNLNRNNFKMRSACWIRQAPLVALAANSKTSVSKI